MTARDNSSERQRYPRRRTLTKRCPVLSQGAALNFLLPKACEPWNLVPRGAPCRPTVRWCSYPHTRDQACAPHQVTRYQRSGRSPHNPVISGDQIERSDARVSSLIGDRNPDLRSKILLAPRSMLASWYRINFKIGGVTRSLVLSGYSCLRMSLKFTQIFNYSSKMVLWSEHLATIYLRAPPGSQRRQRRMLGVSSGQRALKFLHLNDC
jgi:hypothetical protein